MSPQECSLNLHNAKIYFTRIVACGAPLDDAYRGIETVLHATVGHEPASEFPQLTEELNALIQLVTLPLMEAASKWITRELVQMGMTATSALVTGSLSDPLRFDRRCYASLLRCDLAAAVCRQEIARRGDPLVRAIGIQLAWSASDQNEHPLQ